MILRVDNKDILLDAVDWIWAAAVYLEAAKVHYGQFANSGDKL